MPAMTRPQSPVARRVQATVSKTDAYRYLHQRNMAHHNIRKQSSMSFEPEIGTAVLLGSVLSTHAALFYPDVVKLSYEDRHCTGLYHLPALSCSFYLSCQ